MPRGYRNLLYTPFGLVIAYGVWSLNPEQPKLTGDTARQEKAEGYRAGGDKCEPEAIAALSGWKRSRRAETCRQAEEQDRQDTNSFIEARRSADAADASVIAAYQQARIANWALLLGGITTVAAIAAAFYAKQAAQAAVQQLMLAYKPQLFAHQLVLRVRPGQQKCCINLVNEGGENANIVSGHMITLVAEHLPQRSPFEDGAEPSLTGVIVRKGDYMKWCVDINLCAKDIDNILSGVTNLYVFGRIRYNDREDMPHRTLFCRRYCPKTDRYLKTDTDDFEYRS